MNDDHIFYFNILDNKELKKIRFLSFKINDILIKLFNKINITLIDFKLEFGKYNNSILLADEISPDNCRLWEKNTKINLDKDIFRKNNGDLLSAYNKILNKLNRI